MASLSGVQWEAIARVLQARRAKQHKRVSGTMVYYSPTTGKFQKVWRSWGGWNLTEHDTCPCG